MVQIFVFGTLKEGFPNFKVNKGQRVSGEFKTQDVFSLYLVGERHSPWLLKEIDKGIQVSGQVFEVDEQSLILMDKLERVSEHDGYLRVEIIVINQHSQERLKVFSYMKMADQLLNEKIMLGPLCSYDKSHSQLYRAR